MHRVDEITEVQTGHRRKRLFDLSVTLLAAVPAVVICLVAIVPIFFECRTWPIFSQIRLGRDEKPFRLLKLRTMRVDTQTGPSHEIGAAMILRSGRFMRATKIDELPQLWNVLCGDMSLVGPRPGLPSQAELTDARRSRGVFALLPGVTGPSQIAGLDMSRPERLARCDATYLAPWTLRNDIGIIMKTISGSGRGDAARSGL